MSSAPVKREIKQERAARTREEILEAAIKEFSSRSFEATSMAQLAKTIAAQVLPAVRGAGVPLHPATQHLLGVIRKLGESA